MSQPTRIIDTHQHVFWLGRDDADLVADMDEHGIEISWLLSWEIPPFEDSPFYHTILNPLNMRADGTHAGVSLRDVIQTRDRYPDRFLVGYCPHPCVGNAPALLRQATEMYDVRVCGEWKFRVPFGDPRCLELFDVAGELGLPIVLHLDVPFLYGAEGKIYQPNWYGGTVDNLERALQACPGTTFIGHAPGFWREISGDADADPEAYPFGPVTPGGKLSRLFDSYPNLYADLSANSGRRALERDPAHALSFLERYCDRLLFSRDCYGQELHQVLMELELAPELIEKLYYSNAIKLLARD